MGIASLPGLNVPTAAMSPAWGRSCHRAQFGAVGVAVQVGFGVSLGYVPFPCSHPLSPTAGGGSGAEPVIHGRWHFPATYGGCGREQKGLSVMGPLCRAGWGQRAPNTHSHPNPSLPAEPWEWGTGDLSCGVWGFALSAKHRLQQSPARGWLPPVPSGPWAWEGLCV